MKDSEDQIARSRAARQAEPISLLSANGRVLIGVNLNPGEGVRQLTERLGLSDPQVRLSLAELRRNKIIRRTQRAVPGRPATYVVNAEALVTVHGIGKLRVEAFLDSVVREE